MAIALPERTASAVGSLTPRQIVAELDKFVVGQAKAKRAVAIALRNRFRRQQLPAEMAEEVTPKNILMIGPTGVGKTEIARRLAKLAQSPFIKVEASKFTEVGYVGRDVESMVRDLVELAVDMVRGERAEEVGDKARLAAEERLLDLLLPPTRGFAPGRRRRKPAASRTRERMREQLRAGRLDERIVELDTREPPMPSFEVIAGSSAEEISLEPEGHDGPVLPEGPEDPQAAACPRRSTQLDGRGAGQAGGHGVGGPDRRAAGRAERHHLHRRDRQDRQPRRRPRRTRPRRQPRGRAARHPADRRGHDREHQARHGADRPHPVHRRRGVPRVEAVGSHPRAAGTLSDPRRAGGADARRLRPHPHRAARRAGEAVHGAARRRGRDPDVHARTRWSGSPTSPPASTTTPRTSAPAGCTP